MFTPQEIQEQTFSKAVFGGYDMQQVDDFLEPLTEDYIMLYKENSVLKSKMKVLVEKLEEYRGQEAAMKQQMAQAQAQCDRMIAEAQSRSATIVAGAETTLRSQSDDLKKELAEEPLQQKIAEDEQHEQQVDREIDDVDRQRRETQVQQRRGILNAGA